MNQTPLTDVEIIKRFPRMRKDTAMLAVMNRLVETLTERGYAGLEVTPYTTEVIDNLFGPDRSITSGYNLMQTTPLSPPRIIKKRLFGFLKRNVTQTCETRKLVHGHIEDSEITVLANERDLVTTCEGVAEEVGIRVSYNF
jgi:hypothetical protein